MLSLITIDISRNVYNQLGTQASVYLNQLSQDCQQVVLVSFEANVPVEAIWRFYEGGTTSDIIINISLFSGQLDVARHILDGLFDIFQNIGNDYPDRPWLHRLFEKRVRILVNHVSEFSTCSKEFVIR